MLAGGAGEATEGLVYFLQAGDEVGAAEGFGVVGGAGEHGLAGALEGVDLGQGGADDEGVGDSAAQVVDAFGEAAAEDEGDDVGEGELLVDPGGLAGEIDGAGLEGAAQAGVGVVEDAEDFFGVGVAGEKRDDGRGGGGLAEGGEGGGGGRVVALALAETGVHAEVEGDVVGVGAPGRGRGEKRERGTAVESERGGEDVRRRRGRGREDDGGEGL